MECAEEIALNHPGDNILIVTHGGVLQGLFRHALGLPLAGPRRFSLFNAGIHRFAVAGGEWRLVSWGETWHLRGPGTEDDR